MIHQISYPDEVERLAFVSDLHLYCRRFDGERASEHLDLIARAIGESDVCVWGGDLFDFRWSRLGDEKSTISEALRWLDDWYERFPSVRFVFLDGNHDAHAQFAAALSSWSADRERFECGLNCLRIEDTLLLHGDVIEGGGTPDAFADYRDRWSDRPTAGRMASGVYDLAIATRVHRAAAVAVHRRRSTCLRLMRWLHQQPDGTSDGIRRIVFGHTHRLIDGYRVQGIEFYNGGAAIRHVPFSPVQLSIRS